MRLRTLAAPLLALLLLAGCGDPAGAGPGAPTASPSGSPAPSAPSGPAVEVHWDALEGRQPLEIPVSTARRLSEDWMDDLVPGDYGATIPYIGGEQRAIYDYGDGEVHYETGWLYGLCTPDGLLLTDPVFTGIYRLSWYDRIAGISRTLPVWCVLRTLWDPAQAEDQWTHGWYTAVGLAAADGSWYTGTRFAAGMTGPIAVGPYSALMMEDRDNAVLISLSDGSELARYSPYDFIGPEDPDGIAEWLFADGLQWGMVQCVDRYFYCDPSQSGGMLQGDPIWIDGETGAFLDEPPMEIPAWEYTDKLYFDGGWYEDPPPQGPLVLHYDDGAEEILPYDPSVYGELASAGSRYLVFVRYHDEGDADYVLTDHSGTPLWQAESGSIWLCPDEIHGRQWPVCLDGADADTGLYRCTVLIQDDPPAFLCTYAYPTICGGFLAVVEDSAYRLVDLEDGGREIFRLPRWAGMTVD